MVVPFMLSLVGEFQRLTNQEPEAAVDRSVNALAFQSSKIEWTRASTPASLFTQIECR